MLPYLVVFLYIFLWTIVKHLELPGVNGLGVVDYIFYRRASGTMGAVHWDPCLQLRDCVPYASGTLEATYFCIVPSFMGYHYAD